MSKSTLSGADSLFVGRGYNARTAQFFGRPGVPAYIPVRADLGAPAVADADLLIVAATSTELPNASTKTYTCSGASASPYDGAAPYATINGVTCWDVRDGATYGRNLVSVTTHSSAVVASTILISGYDYTGQPMSELHTVTAGTTSKTVTGTKAFAYVHTVAIYSASDATANTVNIGTGSKLGLPFKLASLTDCIQANIAGVQELINVASNATVVAAVTSTATTSTGDVRGTVTFNTALDGSKHPTLWYYVAGHATGAGIAGVAQA